jgi:hypothetical protein
MPSQSNKSAPKPPSLVPSILDRFEGNGWRAFALVAILGTVVVIVCVAPERAATVVRLFR